MHRPCQTLLTDALMDRILFIMLQSNLILTTPKPLSSNVHAQSQPAVFAAGSYIQATTIVQLTRQPALANPCQLPMSSPIIVVMGQVLCLTVSPLARWRHHKHHLIGRRADQSHHTGSMPVPSANVSCLGMCIPMSCFQTEGRTGLQLLFYNRQHYKYYYCSVRTVISRLQCVSSM